MDTYPARIPASVFTHHRRRPAVPAPRPRPDEHDDVYVPRPPAFMSIAFLRDAIATIDAKVAALLKERAELDAKLDTAVRLQSPVLRLPSELLSSIFTLGVLDTGDDNPVMVPTLMLVCRYWADVALNTPMLWAKISVGPHDSLDKAKRRLMRSKSCPLDVTLNFGTRVEFNTHSIDSHLVDAMDVLRSALWRTKSFSLTVPNRAHAYAALLATQEDAPMLEHLTITVSHSIQDDRYPNPPVPLFNGCTPNLRSCSLTSLNFGWDLKLLNALRVLKLGGYYNASAPTPSNLIDILRQCPQLEELALRNMSDAEFNSCSPAPMEDLDTQVTSKIHLLRLKKISFYYSGIGITREVMSHITFPNLESLELAYLENVNPLLQLLYAQALTRLPLKCLRIDTCLFGEMKFINLLRKLPSLVYLQLVDVEDVSHSSLKALSSHQPWACPRLEYVTLDGCTSFDWDSLRAFVESRLPADPHAYKRYHTSVASIVSSASAAAADYARMKSRTNGQTALLTGPQRIRMLDLTRCSQINRESIQWLRMYVETVRASESAKGVWGESGLH